MKNLQNISRLILFSLVILFIMVSPMDSYSYSVEKSSNPKKEQKSSNESRTELSVHKVFQQSNTLEIDFSEAEFINPISFKIFAPNIINQNKEHSFNNNVFNKILFNFIIATNAP